MPQEDFKLFPCHELGVHQLWFNCWSCISSLANVSACSCSVLMSGACAGVLSNTNSPRPRPAVGLVPTTSGATMRMACRSAAIPGTCGCACCPLWAAQYASQAQSAIRQLQSPEVLFTGQLCIFCDWLHGKRLQQQRHARRFAACGRRRAALQPMVDMLHCLSWCQGSEQSRSRA